LRQLRPSRTPRSWQNVNSSCTKWARPRMCVHHLCCSDTSVHLVSPSEASNAANLTVSMQASTLDGKFENQARPTKNVLEHGRKLLTTALLVTNTPPAFLDTPYFKAYVQLVSGGHHFAPTRYLHMQTVKQLAAECQATIRQYLDRAPTFSIEEDAWTGDGRKFSAVTAGMCSIKSVCTLPCCYQ
jgi:hypothetical protein